MGRAMVARLRLELLLVALLLPTAMYSATVVTLSGNSSQSTLAARNPGNATTKMVGRALQSTASVLVVLVSLLFPYR
ncbi:signal transducer CD24-like [Nycticebus coucang]|uniref:signal transducer CD24-like n=1 Tax=Nycticebus coucang TaxID=9470 RepID=UPI00234D4FEC|nr:signal transducer CD24-like [Nycticebus coucang]